MCLITKQKKPKIAKEDIIVYKVLVNYGNRLHSPYQWYLYKLNELVTIDKFGIDYSRINTKLFFIYEGLHSYISKELAFKEQKSWVPIENISVYEGIVPKGSEYYVSKDRTELVSNNLIIKRKIKSTTN